MNSKERWLLDKIKDYGLLQDDIDSLKRDLEELSYRMSASYNFSGAGGGSGYGGSKVETMSIKRVEISKKLQAKQRDLAIVDRAIRDTDLTKRERDLIEYIAKGNSLSSFARQRNIYKSHIYKIRDGALKKMVKHLESTKSTI